jgi:transcriptional regulator PpsR
LRSEQERSEVTKIDVVWGADTLKPFESPLLSIGGVDAHSAARLIAAASDVALVLDRQGIIRDVAFSSEELVPDGYDGWVGRRWADVVTLESRAKVEALLMDASTDVSHKWRHVNHPVSGGIDLPVLYSAVQVGQEGRVVAFGRDMRSLSSLQQRLIDAQQSIERDYAKLRQLETRYRLLFQMTSEAVLIVEAGSQRVMEANPAAVRLLGPAPKGLVGRTFPEGFDEPGMQTVQDLLASVRAAGRAEDVRVRLVDEGRELQVAASLVRQDNAALFLVRLSPCSIAESASGLQQASLDVMEQVPDGFVLTDEAGRVLSANHAFLDLAQLATVEQARGEPLERWLGRPGVDFKVLMVNLRQHGSVRLFSTLVRGEHGSDVEVEISAVAVPHGETPCLGFTVRGISRRIEADPRLGRDLPRSVEQLTGLVGRVSLKELVRESTDLIEKLCIEAALELTHDNRASAAEMLGLSRQSLYVKLRRYGIGDLNAEHEDVEAEG